MHSKRSSRKWRPFGLGLNLLTHNWAKVTNISYDYYLGPVRYSVYLFEDNVQEVIFRIDMHTAEYVISQRISQTDNSIREYTYLDDFAKSSISICLDLR